MIRRISASVQADAHPAATGRRRPATIRRRCASVASIIACLGLWGCEDPVERSVVRGDRYRAVDEAGKAVAEYLLARRMRGDTEEILLRLGHAYAAGGDVEEAVAVYETLVEREPRLRHQVAASLAEVAWSARERGASENMARALQPLLDWGLGYVPSDLQLSLAAYYAGEGEYDRSLPIYLALLSDAENDPSPAALYEVGLAFEQLGACERALPFFSGFLEAAGRSDPNLDAARFHFGSCLFAAAEADRVAGRPSAVLEKLDRLVEVGVPRTLMVEAYFLRGEMLVSLDRADEARASYERVLELNPTRTHALARRAEERLRQIRFGFE